MGLRTRGAALGRPHEGRTQRCGALDGPRELLHGHGLEQETHDSEVARGRVSAVVDLCGHEHDRHVGADASHLLKEIQTVHARHAQVRDQDVIGTQEEAFEPFGSVCCGIHSETGGDKSASVHMREHPVVLDEEDARNELPRLHTQAYGQLADFMYRLDEIDMRRLAFSDMLGP